MIIDTLKKLLANHIESAMIVHGYHWNVEGVNFNEFHAFFGDVYDDYQDQIDPIAEYIRIVSNATEYVNASIDIVKLNTTIKSNPIVGDKSLDMCSAIDIINTELITNFTELFTIAQKDNHQDIMNYCADRINALNKLHWKLLVTTKTTGK
jgi:starvation-inducible DNA-binding protein